MADESAGDHELGTRARSNILFFHIDNLDSPYRLPCVETITAARQAVRVRPGSSRARRGGQRR
jgi:hypothetical protein